MMILQRAPAIFLRQMPANEDNGECVVFSATIETQPDTGPLPWQTVDWKNMASIPTMPDATFAQLEQQARQSLVENLRAVADAIEAEQYAQPAETD
jgi:hypothetical protein